MQSPGDWGNVDTKVRILLESLKQARIGTISDKENSGGEVDNEQQKQRNRARTQRPSGCQCDALRKELFSCREELQILRGHIESGDLSRLFSPSLEVGCHMGKAALKIALQKALCREEQTARLLERYSGDVRALQESIVEAERLEKRRTEEQAQRRREDQAESVPGTSSGRGAKKSVKYWALVKGVSRELFGANKEAWKEEIVRVCGDPNQANTYMQVAGNQELRIGLHTKVALDLLAKTGLDVAGRHFLVEELKI